MFYLPTIWNVLNVRDWSSIQDSIFILVCIFVIYFFFSGTSLSPYVLLCSPHRAGCCVFKWCVKAIAVKCLRVVPPFDTWHEQALQTACLMSLVETGKWFHVADIFTVDLLLKLFKHISGDRTRRANSILITFWSLITFKAICKVFDSIVLCRPVTLKIQY